MHWLDSTLLAVLAAAAVLGAYSGLLMQVFRLVGFAAALYAASMWHNDATAWLRENLLRGADPQVVSAVAYGGLFLGIYLAVFMFTLLLERGVRDSQLQYANRGLGAMLAVGKMGAILGIACYGLQQLQHEPTNQVLAESIVAPILAKGVEQAVSAVPPEYKTELLDSVNQLRESLPKTEKQKIGVIPPPLSSKIR